MSASNYRWKMMAAVTAALGLLIAVNFLVIRWARKFKNPPNIAQTDLTTLTQANGGDAMEVSRPVRPALMTIAALSFDDKEGALENFDHLGHWERGTWVRYQAIDFGAGVSSVVTVLSCARQFEGRTLFFHLDARDGPVIADLYVPITQGFEAVAAPVQGVTGIHDVFLTCTDGGFNLQSIKFIRPQSATNVIAATSYSAFRGIKEPRPGVVGNTDGGDWIKYDQIDFGEGVSSVAVDLAIGAREAKIEFHLDAVDGALIATLVPTSTGNWNTFQVQETPVQGVAGIHDLYLMFRGERGLPDLRSIQFKAAR